MAKDKVYTGTGRRKTSVARVKLIPGKGNVTINGRDVHEYLPYETLIMDLMQPLVLTKTNEMFDVEVNVTRATLVFLLPVPVYLFSSFAII